jgi:hypothetical protein
LHDGGRNHRGTVACADGSPIPAINLGVTRWWVSVVAYEAALVISDLASEAGTSGVVPFFDGPVERFWRDFWRGAPNCSLARRATI